MQRAAAGADKNEFGLDVPVGVPFLIPHLHTPSVAIAAHILDSIEEVDGESFLIPNGIEKSLSESAIIHIRTCHHACRRNFLGRIAAFHDERDPFLNLLLLIRVFHPPITVMSRECLKALFEERDVLRSTYKTHMGYGMNKRPRVLD